MLVEKLASIGCSIAEIAACCDCSRDTIERRFAAIVVKGKEKGRMTLRRMQWKAAEGGNATMLIWLGKQMLDQKDVTKTEFTNPDRSLADAFAHAVTSANEGITQEAPAPTGSRTTIN